MFLLIKVRFQKGEEELTPDGDVSWSVTAILPCTVAFVNSVMNGHLNNVGDWRIMGYCHSLRDGQWGIHTRKWIHLWPTSRSGRKAQKSHLSLSFSGIQSSFRKRRCVRATELDHLLNRNLPAVKRTNSIKDENAIRGKAILLSGSLGNCKAVRIGDENNGFSRLELIE